MNQLSPDGPVGWIREIVLNTPDPQTLAQFWAALLGGTPTKWHDDWITLEPPPHGQRLSFQRAQLDRDSPGVHFDVLVSDLEEASRRVVEAGGEYVREMWSPRPDPDGQPVPWRVFKDPDGHEFCLVVR